MSWSSRLFLQMLRATIIICILGFATGPRSLSRKLDETLVSAWKAAGGSIIHRDLALLSRQLDEERDLVDRMRMRRDALTTRLRDLELRSFPDRIASPSESRPGSSVSVADRPRGEVDLAQESDRPAAQRAEGEGESAQTERAFGSIVAEIRRVDRQLEAAERALRAKERDLSVLEVTAEARRIRQELAEAGEPQSWGARAGYLLELLQPISAASSD